MLLLVAFLYVETVPEAVNPLVVGLAQRALDWGNTRSRLDEMQEGAMRGHSNHLVAVRIGERVDQAEAGMPRASDDAGLPKVIRVIRVIYPLIKT